MSSLGGNAKIKNNDPLQVIVEFLRILQDLLLLYEPESPFGLLSKLIEQQRYNKLCLYNFLTQLLKRITLPTLVSKYLTESFEEIIFFIKFKMFIEEKDDLLAGLAAKNETLCMTFLKTICENVKENLYSNNDENLNFYLQLSTLKEILNSLSLKKDLIKMNPEILKKPNILKLKIYSEELFENLMRLSKQSSSNDNSSKNLNKKIESVKSNKTSSTNILNVEDKKPKREVDNNLKKLLQMAEKKTLKKVLKEFYSRWVKISEESNDIQKNAHIMGKTLNVVEIIIKMRKFDDEIISQIFKIFQELLNSPNLTEQEYIEELLFLMYSLEKGPLKPVLMKNIVNLSNNKEIIQKCYQNLSEANSSESRVHYMVFLTDFMEKSRESFHYVTMRKQLLVFLDDLIFLVQERIISSDKLIERKTVVNLMVELSFFLDQSLFDPILSQFSIEQQALIKIYITKKLSKENS